MTFIAGLDLETTGLLDKDGTPGDQRIIEVSVQLWDASTRTRRLNYAQRIDPQRSISADATRIHKITLSDLAGCPTWDMVAPKVHAVLRKAELVVAHNGAGFDMLFLNGEFKRIKLPGVPCPDFDTMLEGRWATPTGAVPSLQALCFACGVDYDPEAAHAAEYDVNQMMACFFKGLAWGKFALPDPLKERIAA